MRAVELNLTEQLFASRLGIRTILFRPPYSIDAEPDTEDQVRPLETTQDMGYITIGDKIDPNDWRDNPRHSADQIVADVLAHLPPCAAERHSLRQHHPAARWRRRSRTDRAGPAQNHRRRAGKGIADRSALPSCWAGRGRR